MILVGKRWGVWCPALEINTRKQSTCSHTGGGEWSMAKITSKTTISYTGNPKCLLSPRKLLPLKTGKDKAREECLLGTCRKPYLPKDVAVIVDF